MKNILLHGLGQSAASWDNVIAGLNSRADCLCPELSELAGDNASYSALYKGFCDYCGEFSEKINLCGLSLGGILALNYAIDFPDEVSSLAIIGTQYKMPKALLRFQNLIFHFMPNSEFEKIGFGKADFIGLSKSMMNLDFGGDLGRISHRTLVAVGERDKPNRKAAEEMSRKIAGSVFRVIENSGHEVNVDNPARLADLLNELWSSLIVP